MSGLGKKRSKLGKWLDDHGITQQWLAKDSGASRSTVSEMCKADADHQPRSDSIKKVMKSLRKINANLRVDDFFDM